MKNPDTNSVKNERSEIGTLLKEVPILEDFNMQSYMNADDTNFYQYESEYEQFDSWYKEEQVSKIKWERSVVVDTERWEGEVINKEINSFDAILELKEYHSKRLVKIKKEAVDRYTWENIHEGSHFVWNFKTERSAKGTIRKKNHILLINELKLNMSNIQRIVEVEMEKFANLFDDD